MLHPTISDKLLTIFAEVPRHNDQQDGVLRGEKQTCEESPNHASPIHTSFFHTKHRRYTSDTMLSRPFRFVANKANKSALKKAESHSSTASIETESSTTDYCNSCEPVQTSLESMGVSSVTCGSSQIGAHKTVAFQLDQDENVIEHVYEYPAVEEGDKGGLFWSKQDVAARRKSRDAMGATDCPDRSRFIACVEELFQVPMHKRQNLSATMNMTQEDAIQVLAMTDYRGYEDRCCRAFLALRKQVIRRILASLWVRGSKNIEDLAFKLSQRQVEFALLVAQVDAKVAAEYLASV